MSETTDSLATTTSPARRESSALRERVRFLLANKETQRFLKFLVVGTIGAAIDYGTFTGLNVSGWLDGIAVRLLFGFALTGLGIAGAIAFTLAVISNFIWNRYWTYPDSRSKSLASQMITFFAVNAIGVLIRIPILELLSRPIGELGAGLLPHPAGIAVDWVWLGKSIAWAIAVTVVLFWNFFVNRYWTYNDVK